MSAARKKAATRCCVSCGRDTTAADGVCGRCLAPTPGRGTRATRYYLAPGRECEIDREPDADDYHGATPRDDV